jgi:hypothetical protein
MIQRSREHRPFRQLVQHPTRAARQDGHWHIWPVQRSGLSSRVIERPLCAARCRHMQQGHGFGCNRILPRSLRPGRLLVFGIWTDPHSAPQGSVSQELRLGEGGAVCSEKLGTYEFGRKNLAVQMLASPGHHKSAEYLGDLHASSIPPEMLALIRPCSGGWRFEPYRLTACGADRALTVGIIPQSSA